MPKFEQQPRLNKETRFVRRAGEDSFVGNDADHTLNSGPGFSGWRFLTPVVLRETIPAAHVAVDPHDEAPEAGEDNSKCNGNEEDCPGRHIGGCDLFVHLCCGLLNDILKQNGFVSI